MTRPTIDPALGLDLTPQRTLSRRDCPVSVIIPAHNEQETVAEVVAAAQESLRLLGVSGEVIVSASACTDQTADVATAAGATVVQAPAGKGQALQVGAAASRGDIICLIDGDFRYFGDPPLAAALVEPILHGTADVTIADLYWRPLYPQLWLYGFFTPLAGRLVPELLSKVGTTPWSGQRAALRSHWPSGPLPEDFRVDLALLLHWNDSGARMRPVIADDWTNPQRPKPDLIVDEFRLLTEHALRRGRISAEALPALEKWFAVAHELMARYRPSVDDPTEFEQRLLEQSLAALGQSMA